MREAASLNAMAGLSPLCGGESPAKPRRRREQHGENRIRAIERGKRRPAPPIISEWGPLVCGGVRAGEAMYPLFYWTGLATFFVWSVLSVYSAVHGF